MIKGTYLSTVADGSMKSKENKEKFLEKKGIREIIIPELEHGKRVVRVGRGDKDKKITADGVFTTDDIALGVTVADCLPIYFYSDNLTAIFHAGWRGLDKGIVEEGLDKISEVENLDNLSVFIGPAIGVCHYRVGKELVDKFSDFEDSILQKEESFLNLKKVAKNKLKTKGVRNIRTSKECTFCSRDRFSYRRDKKLKVMLGVITPEIKNYEKN